MLPHSIFNQVHQCWSRHVPNSWIPSNCLKWKRLSVCRTIARRATNPKRAWKEKNSFQSLSIFLKTKDYNLINTQIYIQIYTSAKINKASIIWTPLSRGWMRTASLKSWNRIRGNWSRRVRSQNPANSGTYLKIKDVGLCNHVDYIILYLYWPFLADFQRCPGRVWWPQSGSLK